MTEQQAEQLILAIQSLDASLGWVAVIIIFSAALISMTGKR